MRVSLVVAVMVLVASMAHAAPTLVPTASTLSFQLLTLGTGIPIYLTPGPQGATTVNEHQTGASSTVTSSLVGVERNITRLDSGTANATFVRLVSLSTSGALSECAECALDLRVGATTSRQITITNGVMTQSSGSWIPINPNATAGSTVWIWAIAKTAVIANNNMDLHYALEVKSAGAGTAKAVYTNLTTTYVV